MSEPNGGFVHLHLHTEYSLLDGACRLSDLFEAVRSRGQTAVAITDHGVMYGVVDFYKLAKKHGVKPIIGCEVYVAPRSRFDKTKEAGDHAHLILLCENAQGYRNLIELVSRGYTEGFYSKPRIDRELLEQHHEGLIALSACLSGELPRRLLAGDYDGAREIAGWYDQLFGRGNYYIELQDHGLREQKEILPRLIRLSRETGIPLVATNDVHYIHREDARIQQVLICIQTNNILGEKSGLEFEGEEFYLKSSEEMRALFSDVSDACDNTQRIADRCHFDFEFGKTHLPEFQVEGDHFILLKTLAEQGLQRHYGDNPAPAVRQRLDYELSVIGDMGYVDYYLIVRDFIAYARSHDIPVGPGRGSGAGSLVAYCVGITGIDPIRYQLLFERFLNPERISMPDFDIDFCYVRRQEVIDYVVNKYGADHVAQIVTFGTMAARAAIRDVGRAMGLSYAMVDAVARRVPMELNITIDKALKTSPPLREMYETDAAVKELLDTARRVEGMPRHASTHAAGVVITREPVNAYVPLSKNDDAVVAQFTMTVLEELGLLKIDFLGLRNLTVIHDAEQMIRKTHSTFSMNNIPLDDPAVYRMMAAGRSEGVFQFESEGMKKVLTQLKPTSVEDLIAVISLYRPGPMKSIPTYIKNRHHPDQIIYRSSLLKPILEVTYGCLVYQEQVMQVFRVLAGYSYGRADIVRRAMSKKKHDVLEKERSNFLYGIERADGSWEVEGAVRRGVDVQTAEEIFDEMTSFASYAFNKSHAAAYATVAYRTAYLKCHYPLEYMAALLTSVIDSPGKAAHYIAECVRQDIAVLPSDVNTSQEGFLVQDGKILFGLLAVKNLGRGLIGAIVRERELSGPFMSFYDFCKRMHSRELNRRALESLIKCGAMDKLGANRHQMLLSVDPIISQLDEERRQNVEGQLGFFAAGDHDGFVLPEVADLSSMERLEMEKETTGVYISGHPVSVYLPLFDRLRIEKSSALEASPDETQQNNDGAPIRLLGILTDIRAKSTKTGATMAYATLEDMYGSAELIVFPNTLKTYTHLLQEGNVVMVSGRISARDDRDSQVICNEVSQPEQLVQATSDKHGHEKTPRPAAVRHTSSAEVYADNEGVGVSSRFRGLHLRMDGLHCESMEKLQAILGVFEGQTPVYIKCRDTGKLVLTPRRLWVSLNEPMMEALRQLLGPENVTVLN